MASTPDAEGKDGSIIELANNTPQFEGNVWDAPTISVDGLAGLAISPHQIKISFAEHYPTQEKLVGKYVANLVMPKDQFLKVVEALAEIAEKIKTTEPQGE